ncbi:MAG: rhodanese-like domain-containing protein [Daejeonella sp.]
MSKYFLILICFITGWFNTDGALAQIKNPVYKLMLDSIYEHKIPVIPVEEFIKMTKYAVYVLDTREKQEFKVSHLKSARNVGYFWFDMRTVYDIPLDASIVAYCSIGNRSEKIAEKLIHAGYRNVSILYGGIFEWINEGQPVYKENGVQTSEVHTYNKEWEQWLEKGTKIN